MKDLINLSGGVTNIRSIVHQFYGEAFFHPELKHFFAKVERKHQENQLVDFLVQMMGGEKLYCGKSPQNAHPHLFIKEHHFEVRHKLLLKAFKNGGVASEVLEFIERMDSGFKKAIVKQDITECKKRFTMDEIIS